MHQLSISSVMILSCSCGQEITKGSLCRHLDQKQDKFLVIKLSTKSNHLTSKETIGVE